MKGIDYPPRDLILGFHAFGDDRYGEDILDLSSDLRKAFSIEPDPWDPDEELATILYDTRRSGVRKLHVQLYDALKMDSEFDIEIDEYENAIFPLRAAMPMWESYPDMSEWTTAQTADTGHIEVWNPTDQPCFQSWVLTLGQWTIPDVSWLGPRYQRVPGGDYPDRMIPLANIDPVHGGARINLDQGELMVESWTGTNLLGELAGRSFFQHVIPPYTPRTLLPISVTNAPSGGARAELHMRRFWSRPEGME